MSCAGMTAVAGAPVAVVVDSTAEEVVLLSWSTPCVCELAVDLAEAAPVDMLAWRELAAAGRTVVAADSRLCPSSSPSPPAMIPLPLAYMTISRGLKDLGLLCGCEGKTACKPCTETLRHQL